MPVLASVLLAVTAGLPSSPQVDTVTVYQPGETVIRSVERDGTRHEKKESEERRVLIELRARPILDRQAPGAAAEVQRQRRQLIRDLEAIDQRVKGQTRARVRREYETLFSGVAATVSAAAIDDIRRLPDVRAVHEDVEVRAQLNESVPLIGAPLVWTTYGVDGRGIKVAVIDTGIDYTHADLGGCFGNTCKVAGGYDYVNDDTDPRDDNGHGTHVAGIVAANGTLKGVAPGATLLAYKVLGAGGSGSWSDIIAALEQAVADGAKIANLSLGGTGNADDALSQAVDNATAAGMLCVVAAGNSGNGYRTIGSPGAARTALTVGAVTNARQIASFSSRGYVHDGEGHLMKPEVAAPGVDIVSTVPKSGSISHPSGYASLNGTSMAAPHVAGAAALLLQWKASQTPAEVKSRLAGSSLPATGDPFSEGVGVIDLPSALAMPVLCTATHADLGVATGSTGTVSFQKTLTFRNTTGSTQSVSFAQGSKALPAGATFQFTPATASVAAGGSIDVTVTVAVDKAVTPDPPEPLAWSTSLVATAAAQKTTVPVYFFEGSVLTLRFDEAPAQVFLLNPAHDVVMYYSGFGTSVPALVRPGTWDVLVRYHTPYRQPSSYVMREEQAVAGELTLDIAKSEATRSLTVNAVDDNQQPLQEFDGGTNMVVALKDPAPGPARVWFLTGSGGGAFQSFRFSPLSSRYLVGVIAAAPAPNLRYFIYSWSGAGFSEDVTLPQPGTPMRRLLQTASSYPLGSIEHGAGFFVRMSLRSIGMLGINTGFSSPWGANWTFSRQTTGVAGRPVIFVDQSNLSLADTVRINGPYLKYDGGDQIGVYRNPFLYLHDDSHPADRTLGPQVVRWDVDGVPNSLPLRFGNSAGRIYAVTDIFRGGASWVTNTLGHLARVSGAEPQFTLTRNGVTVGTYPLTQLGYGISVEDGPHQVQASLLHQIGTVAGTSRAVASFDTSIAADSSPPYVTGFRVEQNGQPTATPVQPSASPTTRVVFEASDSSILSSVTLQWRQTGTNGWTSLPLTNASGQYSAAFGLEGRIDLRVSATDAAGNRFEQEWSPAVITSGTSVPTRPASVQATRQGPSSVAIEWTPSSGASGIREYRVERFPDHRTWTVPSTTLQLLDATDLIDGNAYAYRVVAVGNDNATSPPSPYDVATLLVLQDDPLGLSTPIRSAHIFDLRTAIDAVRRAVGLEPAWSGTPQPAGAVAASHFTAMRDALNDARAVLQLPALQFSVPVAPGAPVRAGTVEELRNAVK